MAQYRRLTIVDVIDVFWFVGRRGISSSQRIGSNSASAFVGDLEDGKRFDSDISVSDWLEDRDGIVAYFVVVCVRLMADFVVYGDRF